jgi:hypothetical protein
MGVFGNTHGAYAKSANPGDIGGGSLRSSFVHASHRHQVALAIMGNEGRISGRPLLRFFDLGLQFGDHPQYRRKAESLILMQLRERFSRAGPRPLGDASDAADVARRFDRPLMQLCRGRPLTAVAARAAKPAARMSLGLDPALVLGDPRLGVRFGFEHADRGRMSVGDADLDTE